MYVDYVTSLGLIFNSILPSTIWCKSCSYFAIFLSNCVSFWSLLAGRYLNELEQNSLRCTDFLLYLGVHNWVYNHCVVSFDSCEKCTVMAQCVLKNVNFIMKQRITVNIQVHSHGFDWRIKTISPLIIDALFDSGIVSVRHRFSSLTFSLISDDHPPALPQCPVIVGIDVLTTGRPEGWHFKVWGLVYRCSWTV
jgi:hypothetical protein